MFEATNGDLYIGGEYAQTYVLKKGSKKWERVNGLSGYTKLKFAETDNGDIFILGEDSRGLFVIKHNTNNAVPAEYKGSKKIITGYGGDLILDQDGNLYAFGNSNAFVLKNGEERFDDISSGFGLDIEPGEKMKTKLTKNGDLVVIHNKILIRRKGSEKFVEVKNQGWYDEEYSDITKFVEDTEGNLYFLPVTNKEHSIWKLGEGKDSMEKIFVNDNLVGSVEENIYITKDNTIFVISDTVRYKKDGETTFKEVLNIDNVWNEEDDHITGGDILELENGDVYLTNDYGVLLLKNGGTEFYRVAKEIEEQENLFKIVKTKRGDVFILGETHLYIKEKIADKFTLVNLNFKQDGLQGRPKFYNSKIFETRNGSVYILIPEYGLMKLYNIGIKLMTLGYNLN